ncbi:Protein involved in biosynthesis of mitomycin antibiotics/polyketide fumonisin [Phytophthora palmivora]|uniref:Protein involved in biosynthesis of mitomycin antibiotics/polyketide fumonisin n=1 Tax=Phytophthora palmivora TaxID=4796 RepID=A0A2P4XDU6_9STRA|nr:Protein involved in biosynthesis of mitomycin antibiotics/polyketide fumonisin [Phytophthora palmivora]
MVVNGLETGAVVQVTHVGSGYSFRALVERGTSSGALMLSFCSMERPYEKLKVALNGHVSWALAAAKFAAFLVEFEAVEECGFLVHFKALAHQKKVSRSQSCGWYLGVASQSPGLIGDAGKGDESLFRLVVVSTRAAFAFDTTRSLMTHSRHSSILSESQRRSFMQNGYLQIRGAVPLTLANAALRRINHDLGIPGSMIDGGVEGAIKLAGNTSNCDAILDLYYLSDVCKYVEALVGTDQVVPPQGAQIALRFPELGEPREPLGTEWHTDGMRQGRLHPFTLLAGIALSNVPEPSCGNLTVFPGSHMSLQSRLTADGKLRGHDDECYKADSVWGNGTLPDLGTPVQLLAARGDLVLAHPNLAHRGGLNFSPDIRYQVYFRIKHKQLDELQEQCTTDLWADLQGLNFDVKCSIGQDA